MNLQPPANNPSLVLEKVADIINCYTTQTKSRAVALEEIINIIAASNSKYHWVGIYCVEPDRTYLRLHDYYVGRRTEHTRISLDKGICGSAARENRTILLNDVHQDTRHIACALETNSELVVPIRVGGAVVAEIDIDSDRLNAFYQADQQLVESISVAIAILFTN